MSVIFFRKNIGSLISVAAVVEDSREALQISREIRAECQKLIEESKAQSARLKNSKTQGFNSYQSNFK